MNEENQKSLLIVEDSDEDFAALERAIFKAKITHPIYRCEDGEEALDFLSGKGEYQNKQLPLPSLIILDLNLPGTDGREVLAELKSDRTLDSSDNRLSRNLQKIPVVVFSTSSNSKDINACYRHGVSGYFVKPMDINRLNQLVKTIMDYWLTAVELPTENS
ncbi:response regulator [Waterburya agarophytonicola K14]|uniref:Response regulator n=1 Tax=Waterburya agarophytonicola KI4 TaxID=2874699 RepID=A0A964FG73_9CYAN|nr:response regulator [Waterburya agarophytonicola]MCC0176218.1 response regulator [Waterburya agarophytonicola KI4]